MNTPHVTCICPTYARVPHDMFCLQEAVYWFTQQTYHNATLLIINDACEQELICEVPYVKIVNLQDRFDSLGDKYNYGLQIATGEIVIPWEDDDISLPNRIMQSVIRLGSMYDYWNPRGSWFEDSRGLHTNHPQGYNHNASAYRRNFALKFPYAKTNTQDADFDRQAMANGRVNTLRSVTPKEWQYIYRWGHTQSGHLSGHANVNAAYKNWRKAIPGTFFIEPRMYRDYLKDTKLICENIHR